MRQTGPNTDAIGARIELRVGEARQVREITIGAGHAGGQLGMHHFGLGDATRAEIRIIGPPRVGGAFVSDWQSLNANRFYDLRIDGTGLTVSDY